MLLVEYFEKLPDLYRRYVGFRCLILSIVLTTLTVLYFHYLTAAGIDTGRVMTIFWFYLGLICLGKAVIKPLFKPRKRNRRG